MTPVEMSRPASSAGVLAGFGVRGHPHRDELELRIDDELLERVYADVAGADGGDSDSDG